MTDVVFDTYVPSQCCTGGDCCGPGSFCCANTGPHEHPELEEDMADCTAKFTSADVTDEVMAKGHEEVDRQFPRLLVDLYDIPDGMTVQRQGDRLVRVETHTLTCNDHIHDALTDEPAHRCLEPWAEWTDSTPGATPHVDVPDNVVDRYIETFEHTGDPDDPAYRERVRRFLADYFHDALLGVKQAEKEQA